MMFTKTARGHVWHILPPPAWANKVMCSRKLNPWGALYCRADELPAGAVICKDCLKRANEMMDELAELDAREKVAT